MIANAMQIQNDQHLIKIGSERCGQRQTAGYDDLV